MTSCSSRTRYATSSCATSRPPGPVVVDLPTGVVQAKGQYYGSPTVKHRTYNPVTKADPARIEAAIDLMLTAKRRLFYCGGGVINAGPRAAKLLAQVVDLTGYPCTLTLMGL